MIPSDVSSAGSASRAASVSSTAPLPSGSATGTSAAPAAQPDTALASGREMYGAYGASSSASTTSFWGGLLSSAKSMWGSAERFFGVGTSSAPTSATDAYDQRIRAEISEAEDRAKAEAAQTHDMRWEQAQILKIAGHDAVSQMNAKVPLTDAQKVVCQSMSPQAQQAYMELSAGQRDQFDTTYLAVGGLWSQQTPASKAASSGMQAMLASGQLLSTDTEGNTMMADLAARVGKPLAPQLQGKGVDTTGQLQNLINMVAYPDQIFQGSNTNVCVSASLQTLMAHNDPAELVRITSGLLFDGKVALHGAGQSNDVLNLSTDELWTQDGGRSSTSELIQGSFDAYGLKFPAYPPGVEAPSVGGGRGGVTGGAGGGRSGMAGGAGGGRSGMVGSAGGGRSGMVGGAGQGNSGLTGTSSSGASPVPAAGSATTGYQLTEFQAQELYQHIDGGLAVPVPVGDSNRQSAWNGTAQSLQSGQPVPAEVPAVDASGKPIPGANHQITLLALSPDGTQVEVQDTGVGKAAWVPVSLVQQRLEAVVLPAQFAANTGWEISPNPQNPGDANAPAGGGRSGMAGAGG